MVVDRVAVDPHRLADRRLVWDPWFVDIPAIGQLCREGVDLDRPVTAVVGENGSGKSTFVEALARYWADRLTAQVKHWTPSSTTEDADLHRALVVAGERPRPQGGCFLRAEAMHQLFGQIDSGDGPHAGATRAFGGALNLRSHGESFLAYLESRQSERGLFILDEPEAALSFTSCMRLLAVLGVLAEGGSQVVLATHSPVLAAFPGATILEFGAHGIRTAAWAELELVQHWQAFLEDRDLYLRHLFD
ncbi:MAG TPA: AAA family ATPase [Jatrophihabitans sp.]|nr:AAA family ATPase [Jatrophihabitans sp.]